MPRQREDRHGGGPHACPGRATRRVGVHRRNPYGRNSTASSSPWTALGCAAKLVGVVRPNPQTGQVTVHFVTRRRCPSTNVPHDPVHLCTMATPIACTIYVPKQSLCPYRPPPRLSFCPAGAARRGVSLHAPAPSRHLYFSASPARRRLRQVTLLCGRWGCPADLRQQAYCPEAHPPRPPTRAQQANPKRPRFDTRTSSVSPRARGPTSSVVGKVSHPLRGRRAVAMVWRAPTTTPVVVGPGERRGDRGERERRAFERPRQVHLPDRVEGVRARAGGDVGRPDLTGGRAARVACSARPRFAPRRRSPRRGSRRSPSDRR